MTHRDALALALFRRSAVPPASHFLRPCKQSPYAFFQHQETCNVDANHTDRRKTSILATLQLPKTEHQGYKGKVAMIPTLATNRPQNRTLQLYRSQKTNRGLQFLSVSEILASKYCSKIAKGAGFATTLQPFLQHCNALSSCSRNPCNCSTVLQGLKRAHVPRNELKLATKCRIWLFYPVFPMLGGCIGLAGFLSPSRKLKNFFATRIQESLTVVHKNVCISVARKSGKNHEIWGYAT